MTTWSCSVCNTRMHTEYDFRNGRHRECENGIAKLNSEDMEALAPWLNPDIAVASFSPLRTARE